jgi:hypothetical protein
VNDGTEQMDGCGGTVPGVAGVTVPAATAWLLVGRPSFDVFASVADDAFLARSRPVARDRLAAFAST